MIGRNVPLERKLIEQRGLLNSLMSHQDSVLSQRLNQRTSTHATEHFFNKIGQMRCNKQCSCPMTSSARASSGGKTVRLSALAVSILITNSTLVGNSTGTALRLDDFVD
ncbi:hypothetical protein QA640_44790 (plasmid) [Bradyrhizobium sp. CB82]|uniref:hypothetical protein n=1 Tax=Bradyrhizobium sp. CB82 TaxID=3039159 RepID=UPI0024B1C653|nr:hypothetical protein [Bradyrhizobium sp. CB82]WFU46154.1 hypothetical protein QA640_44790 [Bradyrhizobium sp. CB82]